MSKRENRWRGFQLQVLEVPSLKKARDIIDQALRDKHTVMLIGLCVVNYTGRAGSVLPEGERIVILKPDGTLLVHQKKKREPVNWNPPGCEARTRLGREGLQILSKRRKPKESLLVLFKELKLAASFELVDEEELQLVGSEEDMIDAVFQDPSLIEDGFRPLEREKSTRYGMVDLYGVDRDGDGVIVEFKRGKATLSGVSQLKRYTVELQKKLNRRVRGVLAAPQISPSALRLLEKEGLEYVKMGKPPSHAWVEKSLHDKRQKWLRDFD